MSRLLAAAACALVLAGCGGAAGDGGEPAPRPYGSPGSPKTVEEARREGGTQLVRGMLLAREGEVRLCTALMESFPPQCAEPSLRVEGLELDAVEGLTSAEGVTWSEREVSVHGRVEGDVLHVGD